MDDSDTDSDVDVGVDLSYIDELLEFNRSYLFFKYKPILLASNVKALRESIKINIEAPTSNKLMYIVSFSKTNNRDILLMVSCHQSTMTSNLVLLHSEDDLGVIITYSKKFLKKKKFTLSHVVKAMKAIETRSISLSKSRVSIEDVLAVS